MIDMNSGYTGYSMSNRAAEAYRNNIMPWSKWTKENIIDAVTEDFNWTADTLKKYHAEVLRRAFLQYDSWHHTGSYFNCTAFYRVDTDVPLRLLDEYAESYRTEKKKKKEMDKVLALVRYGEWTGTRRHPKLITSESYAIIVGNWAYLPGGTKKKVDGQHFTIVDTYSRAPKGTAKVFNRIKKAI